MSNASHRRAPKSCCGRWTATSSRTGPVLAAQVMSIEVQGPVIFGDVSADREPVERRVREAWNVMLRSRRRCAACRVGALLEAGTSAGRSIGWPALLRSRREPGVVARGG